MTETLHCPVQYRVSIRSISRHRQMISWGHAARFSYLCSISRAQRYDAAHPVLHRPGQLGHHKNHAWRLATFTPGHEATCYQTIRLTSLRAPVRRHPQPAPQERWPASQCR